MYLHTFSRHRRVVVVYGLIILALLAQIPLLQRSQRLLRESPSADPVPAAEARLKDLGTALRGARRAGFLTDVPGDSIGGDAGATERYFLTQYVLVPTVLERGTAGEYVVGNFARATIPRRYASLRVVRTLESGLVLFEGESR